MIRTQFFGRPVIIILSKVTHIILLNWLQINGADLNTFTCILLLVYLMALEPNNDPSICIIGAGPSGISAATRLLENNLTNIKILEAEPRIGGRIHSVKFGRAKIDLGARWCHGQKNNIVYNMVKDMKVLDHTPNIMTMLHSSGKYIEDRFTEEWLEILKEELRRAREHGFVDQSLGDYILQDYNNVISIKYKFDKNQFEIARNARSLLEYLVIWIEGAFSWFDPAAKSDYKECEGDRVLNWKDKGYGLILDILMKKYPYPEQQLPIDDKILLNKEVVKIQYDQNKDRNNAQIFCSDDCVYVADHIIFTPSIGVLKEKADRIFEPKLTRKKLDAIANIGYGATMKVVMYFSEQWWKGSPGFFFNWSEDDSVKSAWEFSEGPQWQGKSWITYMTTIISNEYEPHVLTAWFTGNLVPAIEMLPDETIINGIQFTMNKFLRHMYKVGKIEKMIHSTWYSNPHFRGSYSFQTIKTKRKMESGSNSEEDLAEPIRNFKLKPIVQFAGEATHPHFYSTVHGAVETGFREADILINFYKNN